MLIRTPILHALTHLGAVGMLPWRVPKPVTAPAGPVQLGPREQLRLDLAVRSHRHDVVAQLDLPIHLSFDEHILVPTQLALDHH